MEKEEHVKFVIFDVEDCIMEIFNIEQFRFSI